MPYALMLLFIGIPCFFLEISLGQYAALGPATIYSNMAPLFKGLTFDSATGFIIIVMDNSDRPLSRRERPFF